MNSFFNHASHVHKRRAVWNWLRGRHFPGDVLTIRVGYRMDWHSQMLSEGNAEVTVLLLIFYKLPSSNGRKWKEVMWWELFLIKWDKMLFNFKVLHTAIQLCHQKEDSYVIVWMREGDLCAGGTIKEKKESSVNSPASCFQRNVRGRSKLAVFKNAGHNFCSDYIRIQLPFQLLL